LVSIQVEVVLDCIAEPEKYKQLTLTKNEVIISDALLAEIKIAKT